MIYVFLAEGFEESEAVIPVDILRRAGLDVKTVGVTGRTVVSSHRVPVTADITIDEVDGVCEAVVLPGGMPGTLNLEKNEKLQALISDTAASGGIVAAICAAPIILGHKNMLKGRRAVCYPGFEEDLYGALIADERSVTDGNIVTARGAGAAFEFGAAIVAALKGSETAEKILAQMQY